MEETSGAHLVQATLFKQGHLQQSIGQISEEFTESGIKEFHHKEAEGAKSFKTDD